MRQQNGLRHETQQTLRIDPRVILGSQLLQLAQPELEAAIQNELMENPALERLGDDGDELTQETILRTIAPRELGPSSDDREFLKSLPNDSGDADWTDFASGEDSLIDHLRAQLLPRLAAKHRGLGEYLIGSLDERGYLTSAIEEAALDCGCSLDDAQRVLAHLQDCEPAGIGATTLQECLILQLRHDDTIEGKLARTILRNYFDEFRDRNVRPIMRRYRVLPEVVEQAFNLILSLTPFPTEGFGMHAGPSRDPRGSAARPDIAFRRSENGWEIDVLGPEATTLFVSRAYLERQQRLREMANAPRDERAHVNEYVERAQRFIGALEQRRLTMGRVGRYLLERQSGFIETGEYRFLTSMTRTQLARALDLHESTISRATMGKFVQIANGEVVPFEAFFKPALRVQKMIEEILAHENPNAPLSDERIAQMLAERGVVVARRTVNKYRDRTKLLSSRRRRTA